MGLVLGGQLGGMDGWAWRKRWLPLSRPADEWTRPTQTAWDQNGEASQRGISTASLHVTKARRELQSLLAAAEPAARAGGPASKDVLTAQCEAGLAQLPGRGTGRDRRMCLAPPYNRARHSGTQNPARQSRSTGVSKLRAGVHSAGHRQTLSGNGVQPSKMWRLVQQPDSVGHGPAR